MFQTTNEEVKQHLAVGADVNAKDEYGGTLLDWAIGWERTETADSSANTAARQVKS